MSDRLVRYSFPVLCTTLLVLCGSASMNAQDAPSGAIFDLANSTQLAAGTPLTQYTKFTTSFVGDGSTEYVSFAFRDEPGYFSFDNASVSLAGTSTNLLANPGFEQVIAGTKDVGTTFPNSWGRWIQPVDFSGLGQVDAKDYGCGPNAYKGKRFWCDGSVEGFDGLYQSISTQAGQTYKVSFWLDDNSSDNIQSSVDDMLVYAGNSLPSGTESLSNAPEPASFALLGGALVVAACFRRKRNA